MVVKLVKLLQDGFFTINKGLLVYGKTQYYGQKYRGALKPLLVQCDDYWILIDTGMGKCNERYAKAYAQERDPSLEQTLKNLDLTPSDISIVINTHLHFDHCGNNILFKEAEFMVHEDELKYARNPHKFQKRGYLNELFDVVEYKFIRDETTICEGVKVLHTPGHTPGHLSIVVEMDEKRYIYCGDVAPLRGKS
jgi:glyoxylase-like metal-dependent hydrolase (beta-lactamase superfamily II)